MLLDEDFQSVIMLWKDLVEMLQKIVDILIFEEYEVKVFLLKYIFLFVENNFDLGRIGVVKYYINIGDSCFIKQYLRRVFVYLIEEVDKIIDDMLERDVIKLFNSLWFLFIVMVKKKDGLYRFCVDYRCFNSCIV